MWVIGGLYALFGASSMAELGAAIPRSGGQYNFSRRAIGEYAGFIVGWSDWLSTCGTAAAVAIVIGEYSGELFGRCGAELNLIAVVVIVGFLVLQWRGYAGGAATQLVTAAMKTCAFVILVIACFRFGGHAHARALASESVTTVACFLPGGRWRWLMLWACRRFSTRSTGGTGLFTLAEEVRDPGAMFRARFSAVSSPSWGSISCLMPRCFMFCR